MAISLKTYTNRYLVIAILAIMAIWALLFYAVLMDEVYDNIDDGLKNQKIEIIREAYADPDIVNTTTFGINQFRIIPGTADENIDKNYFYNKEMYMPYDEEDEPYRILRTGFYTKDGKPYQLEIRTSTVEEDDFLINLAFSLAVLYVVIALSIIVINYVGLTKALRPFKLIMNGLGNYRFGDSKSFIPIESQVKEFDNLNKHIVQMIDQNEQIFEQQKRFIENASHELQTPLAVTVSKLDLLMDDQLLPEEPLSKIAEAKQSLLRLVGLNKSLLTLSRIDNKQYHEEEVVNFSELVMGLLDDFSDLIQFRELQIEVEGDGQFVTKYNGDLASILISNLLRNAIKYNTKGGILRIRLQRDRIEIANSSLGEALNPDYIFERFHKGSQDSQSNGLGLSIIRSIVDNYPTISVSYTYDEDLHVFSVNKASI
ncbi:sensor histidine kinase [Albibacterium profundi]|uniref:histidine kinase n=1 Tax=Albibacterium profundi TaxID=3134906 RepID=A0ABV5CGK2_9SPHI